MNLSKIEKMLASRWLKRAFQLLILIACIIFIVNRIRQVDFSTIEINFLDLAISFFLTALGTWLGALSWWITLRIFHQTPQLSEIRNIQFKSNLVKYIPGYGWQLVGKSYMTAKIGYPMKVVISSMLFEFIEIFLSGLFLVTLFIPRNYQLIHPIYTIIVQNRFLLQALALVSIITFPFLFQLATRPNLKKFSIPGLDLKWVFILVILLSLTWILNSIGFSCLYSAIGIQSAISLPLTIFIFISTFLIGLVVIIVPGSIGIRESLFILFLSPVIGASFASVISIIYRIITIFTEAFVAFSNTLFMLIFKKNRNV
jgi:hypothetical protein